MISTVGLYTLVTFQPCPKIIGTRKCPKTAQKSQFWGILHQKLHEIPQNACHIIVAVALHTHIEFQPINKIVGTQKWPKTAQNSKYWGILHQKLYEIPQNKCHIIVAVALHTLKEFQPDFIILETQEWPKTAKNSQFWGILHQKLHKILQNACHNIVAVALHTQKEFQPTHNIQYIKK